MMSVIKIHPFIYKILIEKDFDKFDVTCLKNLLFDITDSYSDIKEARKFIYRQLLRLESLGLVRKIIDIDGEKKMYQKTDRFYSTTFILRKMATKSIHTTSKTSYEDDSLPHDPFLTDLKKEKTIHETSLAVILSEIEEYQSLIARFPSKKGYLIHLYHQSKEQAAKMLGKVTALSKVIDHGEANHQAC